MARPKKADARTITYKVRLMKRRIVVTETSDMLLNQRCSDQPCITITKVSEKTRKQKAFSEAPT